MKAAKECVATRLWPRVIPSAPVCSRVRVCAPVWSRVLPCAPVCSRVLVRAPCARVCSARVRGTSPADRPPSPCTNPTTSGLTAATLIYAFGPGIAAAAGSRLAVQLLVTQRIRVSSFQLQNMHASRCSVLPLPPCIEIGEVARLLPSLTVLAQS